jgi:hypothetical protein
LQGIRIAEFAQVSRNIYRTTRHPALQVFCREPPGQVGETDRRCLDSWPKWSPYSKVLIGPHIAFEILLAALRDEHARHGQSDPNLKYAPDSE